MVKKLPQNHTIFISLYLLKNIFPNELRNFAPPSPPQKKKKKAKHCHTRVFFFQIPRVGVLARILSIN
jgi:hypothetical protein